MYGSTQSRDPASSLYEIAEGTISAQHAVRVIQDDLLLDGTPALNLAGFANTFVEPEIEQLMFKNFV